MFPADYDIVWFAHKKKTAATLIAAAALDFVFDFN
jgi:hypothetical protein